MSTSSIPAQTKAPPDPRISVELPTGKRELFMSFGLLKELATLIGGPEAIPQVHFHPATTQDVLTLVLAKRNKRGVIQEPGEDEEPIIPFDMTPEAGEQILDWVAAHALDFFVRRFANSSKLFATQAEQLAAVGSSLTSSAISTGPIA